MEVGKWDQRGEEAQQVPYQTSHSVITLAQPTSELQGKLHPRVVLDRGEGAGALIPLYPSVTEKQDVGGQSPRCFQLFSSPGDRQSGFQQPKKLNVAKDGLQNGKGI